MSAAESQTLVAPYFVRFHTVSEDGTQKAFQAQVVHETIDPDASPPLDQRDLFVFCHDVDNGAGLTEGINWRADVGHGGPGSNVSWSAF